MKSPAGATWPSLGADVAAAVGVGSAGLAAVVGVGTAGLAVAVDVGGTGADVEVGAAALAVAVAVGSASPPPHAVTIKAIVAIPAGNTVRLLKMDNSIRPLRRFGRLGSEARLRAFQRMGCACRTVRYKLRSPREAGSSEGRMRKNGQRCLVEDDRGVSVGRGSVPVAVQWWSARRPDWYSAVRRSSSSVVRKPLPTASVSRAASHWS